MQAIDLTGRSFGQLSVVKKVSVKRSRNARWECLCTCGNRVIVTSLRLRKGHTASCGCRRADSCKGNQRGRTQKQLASRSDETAAVARVFTEYKAAAKKFGRPFELNLEFFSKLVKGNCYYCGIEPFAGPSPRSSRSKVSLNGVDRINSDLGYVTTNVVSCCKFCNLAKRNRTAEEFIAHCKLVAMNWSI